VARASGHARGGRAVTLTGRRATPADEPGRRAWRDRIERVPVRARAVVERRFGVDLSGVEVRRGPDAAGAAQRARARAFTAGEAVHLPHDLGPLDSERARPLLVHELVHVAQQRRLAPRKPDESSTEGRALEAEAQAVERDQRDANEAGRTRLVSEHPGERRSAGRLQELTGPVPDPPGPLPAAAAPPTQPEPRIPAGIQRAAEAPLPDAPAPEANVDEVVSRLYEKLARRLRKDLLVDRERSGLLIDR
jgi:hypothetical protein